MINEQRKFPGDRWEEGERAFLSNLGKIRKENTFANYYWHVVGEQRPEFKDAIIKAGDVYAAFIHASFSRERHPDLEPLMLTKRAISGYDDSLLVYAIENVGTKWPELEKVLLKPERGSSTSEESNKLHLARRYAQDIMKCRWPELEQRMLDIARGKDINPLTIHLNMPYFIKLYLSRVPGAQEWEEGIRIKGNR